MWLVGILALIGCMAGCAGGITLNSIITDRMLKQFLSELTNKGG